MCIRDRGDDIDNGEDGTTLSYTITGDPAEGVADIDPDTNTLTFNPGEDFQNLPAGETRDVTIQITATDSEGATATNDITVTVTGTNDAPTVAAALTAAAEEDGAEFTLDLLDGASDVDNGAVLSVENVLPLPDGLTLSLIHI